MKKARQQSIDLVGFQERLNKSLESLQHFNENSSLLGFTSGGRNWLMKLGDLHEIESVPIQEKIQKLALAKNWVMGIANYKGNIFTLVDFQLFLGQAATQTGLNARSLLLHPRHQVQSALIVGEVAGLLESAELKKIKDGGDRPWVSSQFQSVDGKIWNMVDVASLAVDQEMMNIAN